MNSLYYRDSRALVLWTTSFFTQALGYMAQTSINFGHGRGGAREPPVSRQGGEGRGVADNMAGITPVILNSFVLKPLGHDLSGSGLTANTDNRDLFATPSTMLVGRALSTLQAGGLSLFAGQNFTGKDVRNAMGILPGSNLWGARNLVDIVSSMAPRSELPQPK